MNNEKVSTSYAWVILAVLFVGHMAAFGIRSSFGVYITPWEQEFSVGRSLVSSISMLSFIIFAIIQPLAGKLNDQFGKGIFPTLGIFLMGGSFTLLSQAGSIWQVFLLFGVVFSMGYALCSSSVPVVIITRWFEKKRGLAMGIVMAGFAVGQLILVPVSLYMVERMGWRTTVAVLGIVVLAVVGSLFLFLLRSRPEEKGMKPYGYEEAAALRPGEDETPKESLPIIKALRMRVFWLLAIPYFICGFTDSGLVQTHLIPIAEGKGLPTSVVAVTFIFIALANIGGAILTGHLSDHYSRTKQLAIIYVIRAVTYTLLIVLGQPWLLLVFALLYGFVEMASIAPTNSLTVQIFDGYSIGIIVGLVTVCHHIGGAVGSWVPGLMYDLTGSYDSIMIISIVMLLIGAFISLRIPENQKSTAVPS